MSDSLRPHESQHARPPCPSPTPRVHSDSRPSSRWCHPAILSSVVPFSSCPQSLPASVFSNVSNLASLNLPLFPVYLASLCLMGILSEHLRWLSQVSESPREMLRTAVSLFCYRRVWSSRAWKSLTKDILFCEISMWRLSQYESLWPNLSSFFIWNSSFMLNKDFCISHLPLVIPLLAVFISSVQFSRSVSQ